MRRILITDELKKKVARYKTDLATATKSGYIPPSTKLADLKNAIPGKYSKHAEYIQDIIDNFETIVCLLPSQFDGWYRSLNKWKTDCGYKKALSKKFKYKKHRKEFYKHIVDAMRYDWVQSHIMPSYIESIGVRTCVYCNTQYAVSTDKIKGHKHAYYELDHFKPKSRYPFLCVTFFNLQPSCAYCNKHKSKSDALFNLYTENVSEIDSTLCFRLDSKSVIVYENCFKPEVLKINFDATDKTLWKNHERLFHITKLYARFKKEASEILWLKRAYSPSFLKQVTAGFDKVFPKGMPDVDALYWGHDMNPNKIHARPLNKLAQDLKDSL